MIFGQGAIGLEEIKEHPEDQDNNSEENIVTTNEELIRSKRSDSSSSDDQIDTCSELSSALESKSIKSEWIINDKNSTQKIKLPKLLVLVSKYPIYKDMEEFLKKIKLNLTEYTMVPMESMILNLVYEFPHPSDKYFVESNFWRIAKKNEFEYESSTSFPYCCYKYFLQISKFGDRILKIWYLIERILFEKPVIIISKKK